jgi:3',5'-cyclic AMP phosphodiesterase CpdA
MRLGIITDVHLGPAVAAAEQREGQPVKLTQYAAPLTEQVVYGWRTREQPELVLNLGDVLSDVSRDVDRDNYAHFCSLLDDAGVPVLHVAGNHDQVHLSDGDLLQLWQLDRRWPAALRHEGSTAYAVDFAGYRFVILSTRWQPPEGVFLGAGQLEFLERCLASAAGPCVLLTHQSASEMSLAGNRWFEAEPHLARIHERAELRRILARHGNVLAAFNGHAHWNHVDVIGGVPFITVQSLTENANPTGTPAPAAASAIVELSSSGVELCVSGAHPLRFALRR